MPYKAVGKWVYVKKDGKWVRKYEHDSHNSARKHAAKLNMVVEK